MHVVETVAQALELYAMPMTHHSGIASMANQFDIDCAMTHCVCNDNSHLGLFKGLLQDAMHILVNAVKLLLLDVALLQQFCPVLLVSILVLLDGLQACNVISVSCQAEATANRSCRTSQGRQDTHVLLVVLLMLLIYKLATSVQDA